MANQTDADALRVHGTNPQFLIEKLTRERIYSSRYWREQCFGVSTENVVALAADLTHVGGLYGNARKPAPFICLALKLLQLGPTRDVVQEFLTQPHFKYATILAAFYLRIVGDAVDVYSTLEPLLADYRKLVVRVGSGDFELTNLDSVVDSLLVDEDVFGIKLPRIQHRHTCVELGLPPRTSALNDLLGG
jgi:pre-mRNA-splicing factor 38A